MNNNTDPDSINLGNNWRHTRVGYPLDLQPLMQAWITIWQANNWATPESLSIDPSSTVGFLILTAQRSSCLASVTIPAADRIEDSSAWSKIVSSATQAIENALISRAGEVSRDLLSGGKHPPHLVF